MGTCVARFFPHFSVYAFMGLLAVDDYGPWLGAGFLGVPHGRLRAEAAPLLPDVQRVQARTVPSLLSVQPLRAKHGPSLSMD